VRSAIRGVGEADTGLEAAELCAAAGFAAAGVEPVLLQAPRVAAVTAMLSAATCFRWDTEIVLLRGVKK
jgi:hypothetical protein